MLKIRGLCASIGAADILHEIDLFVGPGETVCLIGPNGAGKTTLMRSIAGLLRRKRGHVDLEGMPIHALPAEAVVTRGVALVPEGRQVFSPLTVLENLQLGAYSRQRNQLPAVRDDLDRVLEMFPKLRERLGQLAGTLSGGEQQMLAIGRALMSRPRLLLLDEPSLGLAPMVVSEIFRTIAALGAQGTSILLAEQNAAMAMRVSARGYVLSEGRCVLDGETKLLMNNPAVREAYLGL